MHFSIDRTVHTTAFDKPVVDHWLERKIATLTKFRTAVHSSGINHQACMSLAPWVVRSIPHSGPIEIFLIPASTVVCNILTNWKE